MKTALKAQFMLRTTTWLVFCGQARLNDTMKARQVPRMAHRVSEATDWRREPGAVQKSACPYKKFIRRPGTAMKKTPRL